MGFAISSTDLGSAEAAIFINRLFLIFMLVPKVV